MGTVHKFKRPPKNEQQFRGYRPQRGTGLASGKSRRWQLRDWQKTVLAWMALILLAAAVWGIGQLFG